MSGNAQKNAPADPEDPYMSVKERINRERVVVLEVLPPPERRAARVMVSGGQVKAKVRQGLTEISGPVIE